MNRFRFTDNGLQRINAQGKQVGQVYNIDDPQTEIILKNIDNPNSDFELVDDNRMAGDAVSDELLKSLEGDVALQKALADAEVYIENRAPELRQLGLTKGGKSLGEAEEKLLQNISQMRGNVPTPLIEQLATRERRTHLQNQVNPVTGETEQIAVMDPMDRNKVMKSEFGLTPTAAGRSDILQADEIASEYALKLMHKSVQNMPHKRFNPQRKVMEHPADFVVMNQDGIRRNVDSEQGTVNQQIVPMQTHTEVAGLINGRMQGIPATQAMLDAELAKGKDIFAVVDDLDAQGKMASELATLSGKVVRGDSSRQMHLNDRYHDLIRPEYSNSVRNADIDNQPRKKVLAPSGFTGVNLALAADAIKQGQGRHPRVGINNMGTGRGHKVNVGLDRNVKVNGEKVFTDLTEVHPLIQQLLSHEEMKKRGVS